MCFLENHKEQRYVPFWSKKGNMNELIFYQNPRSTVSHEILGSLPQTRIGSEKIGSVSF